jgi:hypothetical protein
MVRRSVLNRQVIDWSLEIAYGLGESVQIHARKKQDRFIRLNKREMNRIKILQHDGATLVRISTKVMFTIKGMRETIPFPESVRQQPFKHVQR